MKSLVLKNIVVKIQNLVVVFDDRKEMIDY